MIELFPSRTVFVEIFGWGIHWYGILYFAGFVLGWWLLPRLARYRSIEFSADEWSRILSWAVVGVIVGGRLGYVIFYDPMHYLSNPLDILMVWKGGMSSHGGFIGVSLILYFALRRHRGKLLRIADIVVIPVAIGLALGRVGNYVNLELYGTVTTLPWGIEIPGVEGLRHPTQWYAVAKDLFIALACFLHLRKPNTLPGRTCALFLILYGVLRFIVEYFRDNQDMLFTVGSLNFSRGQLLTLPVFLAGVLLWCWIGANPKKTAPPKTARDTTGGAAA